MILTGGDTVDMVGFTGSASVVGIFFEHISSVDAYHNVGSRTKLSLFLSV